MANRANRQNVIFVIEKIENPIITDSETKFLPALLPTQEPDHAPRHGLRVLFVPQFHLKALPILFRQYWQRRCATSCIDLQIAEYFVNGADRLVASDSDRHQIEEILPPFLVFHKTSEDAFAFGFGHRLELMDKLGCAHDDIFTGDSCTFNYRSGGILAAYFQLTQRHHTKNEIALFSNSCCKRPITHSSLALSATSASPLFVRGLLVAP
jgi:hypothetical protein